MSHLPIYASLLLISAVLYLLWRLAEGLGERRSAKALRATEALGDILPPSIHPRIDPTICIGSGSCVKACPEGDVIGMVGGQARLINPLACIGHGACQQTCPVNAIELVYGTEKRGLELPVVDPNFQTSRPGVYIIGELGGMGLIRNAVSQGRQAAEHVLSEQRRGSQGAFDAIVVGAGPAGISATLGLMQGGLRVALLESEEYGGNILHYPRAKVVMTGALDLPMIGRIKKRKMSKEQLLALWQDIHERAKLPLHTGERIESLQRAQDGMWVASSPHRTWKAANVLLALGRRGAPQKLGVPGEQQDKVHYRLQEPREFRGKHVLVIGGGNSAVENALALHKDGRCASVSISYRRASFARCRAETRRVIEQAIAQGGITAYYESTVSHIDEQSVTLKQRDRGEVIVKNNAVIVQIGGTAPASLLSTFGIELILKYGEA